MKRFGLSTRQLKDLADGKVLSIALPTQPLTSDLDPLQYAQETLAGVGDSIESAKLGSVWCLAAGGDPGDVAGAIGPIVDRPTGAERALVFGVEVVLVKLSTGRKKPILLVRWPGKMLE